MIATRKGAPKATLRVPKLSYMCQMTVLCVPNDCLIYAKGLSYVCQMTVLYMPKDCLMCAKLAYHNRREEAFARFHP